MSGLFWRCYRCPPGTRACVKENRRLFAVTLSVLILDLSLSPYGQAWRLVHPIGKLKPGRGNGNTLCHAFLCLIHVSMSECMCVLSGWEWGGGGPDALMHICLNKSLQRIPLWGPPKSGIQLRCSHAASFDSTLIPFSRSGPKLSIPELLHIKPCSCSHSFFLEAHPSLVPSRSRLFPLGPDVENAASLKPLLQQSKSLKIKKATLPPSFIPLFPSPALLFLSLEPKPLHPARRWSSKCELKPSVLVSPTVCFHALSCMSALLCVPVIVTNHEWVGTVNKIL